MKLRLTWLAILCLVFAAIPAWAQYDNGPISGTTDAWTINFGYVVSDTFTWVCSNRDRCQLRRLGISRRHDADR